MLTLGFSFGTGWALRVLSKFWVFYAPPTGRASGFFLHIPGDGTFLRLNRPGEVLRVRAAPRGHPGSAGGRPGGLYRERLLKLELEHGLAGHLYLLALGQHLDGRARARADARTDRRALTSAGNGTDDGA